MPKRAREMTVIELKHLGYGTFNVGGVKGLYFRKTVRQQLFILRFQDILGRHDYSLGTYPEISLAEARKRAFRAQQMIESGINPIELRKKEKEQRNELILQQKMAESSTFEAISLQWIADRALSGFWSRDSKGERETTRILQKYVFPSIGDMNIEKVTAEHIRICMEPIWQSLPSTAKKARTFIQKIFQWAIALKKRKNTENPASMDGSLGILMEPLQNNRKAKQNHAACSVKELPRLIKELRGLTSNSARACEFAILTATRSQAVRLAHWEEFDLKNGIWVIPIEHDKIKNQNRDRTIFLSRQAITLLKQQVKLSESPYVFPSSHGSHFSDTALTMCLRGLHEKRFDQDGIGWIDPVKSKREGKSCTITIHGTARATFKTWAKDDRLGNNRRFDQEAVELCMLHSKNDAYNGAYDRAPLEKERRKIMKAWGEYCYSETEDLSA